MDFWNELFTALDSNESWQILFWAAAIGLVSFILGLVIRGFAVSRWKRRFKAKESELNKLRAEYNGFQEKYALQEADLQKANLRVEELEAQLRRLEQEKAQMQNDLSIYEEQYNTLKASFETGQTEIQTYIVKIEDLQNQLTELQAENDRLNAEAKANEGVLGDIASFQSSFNATKNQLATLENRLAQLEEENGNLKDELIAVQSIATTTSKTPVAFVDMDVNNTKAASTSDALTLSMIEEKLSAIEDENIMLKNELDQLKGVKVETVVSRSVPRDFDADFDDEIDEKDEAVLASISPEEQSARATARLTAALGNKIPSATEADKDDLKKINGIGPFIEQKLNSLGIFTYEQISQLDGELINTLTDAIQFFPGRIERDDWVGQATKLKGDGGSSTTIKPKKSVSNDDLKVVEGIGPKIEELLKNNGINNWEDLANASVSRLKEILEAAGSRYRVHSPMTWPDQAKLAFLGEWDKLEEFQSYLTGGRDPKKKK